MMAARERLAEVLAEHFNEAVALDAGFNREPPPSYWLGQADAILADLDEDCGVPGCPAHAGESPGDHQH